MKRSVPPPLTKTTKLLFRNKATIPWYVAGAQPTVEDQARWAAAARALNRLRSKGIRRDIDCKEVDALSFLEENYCPPLVAVSSAGLHSTSLFDFYHGFDCRSVATFVVFAVMAIFGLPHLIGWNTNFHTNIERVLWRVATATVAGFGVPVTICAFVFWNWQGHSQAGPATTVETQIRNTDVDTTTHAQLDSTKLTTNVEKPTSTNPPKPRKSPPAAAVHKWEWYIYLPFFFYLIPYILASAYLVVASIQQLFFLGHDDLLEPSFPHYWPHFS